MKSETTQVKLTPQLARMMERLETLARVFVETHHKATTDALLEGKMAMPHDPLLDSLHRAGSEIVFAAIRAQIDAGIKPLDPPTPQYVPHPDACLEHA